MILGFKDVLSGFAFYMIHLGFQLKKQTKQINLWYSAIKIIAFGNIFASIML